MPIIHVSPGGRDSAKIKFIRVLTNPSKRVIKVQGGAHTKHNVTAGYSFRALSDIVIPRCRSEYVLGKDGEMGLSENLECWEPIKAGEQFDLTSIETAHLATQPQYARCFCGGGVTVELLKREKYRQDFYLAIRGGQIRSYGTVDVANVIQTPTGEKYEVKGKYKKKFGYLFR